MQHPSCCLGADLNNVLGRTLGSTWVQKIHHCNCLSMKYCWWFPKSGYIWDVWNPIKDRVFYGYRNIYIEIPYQRITTECLPSCVWAWYAPHLFTIWDMFESQLLAIFTKDESSSSGLQFTWSLLAPSPEPHATKQIGELTVFVPIILGKQIWYNKLGFCFLENPCPKNKTFQPWWFRGESYHRNLYRTNYL